MKTQQQKEAFIKSSRDVARALLNLETLNEEYVATDAGNSITTEDFLGVNAGLVVADLIALYGTPVTDVLALLNKEGMRTILHTLASV